MPSVGILAPALPLLAMSPLSVDVSLGNLDVGNVSFDFGRYPLEPSVSPALASSARSARN